MDEPTTPRQNFKIVVILSFIIIGLRLVALICPHCRLWGINHLLFLTNEFVYGFIIAGLLLLLPLFAQVDGMVSTGISRVSRIFETRRYVWWLIISVLSVILFYLLRIPITLLGDGYAVVNNIGNDLPVVFKWTETGAVHIVYWVSLLLPVQGLARGEYAYAIVSIVSGGISVFLFAAIAFEIAETPVRRLVVFCLLLFSGWLLLFFGYTENYPLMWPFMLLFIWAAITYLNGRRSLLWPLLLYVLVTIIHLQAIFFVPALLVLFFGRGWGHTFYKNHTRLIWSGVVLLILGVTAIYIWKYQTSLGFMVNFLPLLEGRHSAPGYTIFSLKHVLDIGNLSLLLIPVWPVLLYLGWKNKSRIFTDKISTFFAVLSISGLIFIFIIDPRLGMGRDWDLFALAMLGPALLLLRNVTEVKIKAGVIAIIILAAALSTIPFIAVNVSKESSIAYIESLCTLDLGRSRSGLVTLRNYYYDTGDTAKGDVTDSVLIHWFPEYQIGKLANKLIDQKKFDLAKVLADSLYHLNPYVVDGYNMMGSVYLKTGHLDSAEYYLKKSRELGQYEFRTHIHLATVYSRRGDREAMWECLRTAQKLNPNHLHVNQPIAMEFYIARKYDSALVYGRKMITIDSTFADGYLITGLAQAKLGQLHEALQRFEKFLQLDSTPEKQALAERAIRQIKERLPQKK